MALTEAQARAAAQTIVDNYAPEASADVWDRGRRDG